MFSIIKKCVVFKLLFNYIKSKVNFASIYTLFSGQISNANHFKEHIGSPNRNRELGNRPRSGLWQRKTGRFGRKIKPPPPLKIIDENSKKKFKKVTMEISSIF